MATITMIPFVRREKREDSAQKRDRRVVSIDDYRGVVMLPGRNRPGLVVPVALNSGPLSAA